MKPIVYFIVYYIFTLRQRGHQVDGHDPVSPAGFLDAVAASPRPEVGRDGVSSSEELDEAGPSRPPVIVHGVSEAGND